MDQLIAMYLHLTIFHELADKSNKLVGHQSIVPAAPTTEWRKSSDITFFAYISSITLNQIVKKFKLKIHQWDLNVVQKIQKHCSFQTLLPIVCLKMRISGYS